MSDVFRNIRVLEMFGGRALHPNVLNALSSIDDGPVWVTQLIPLISSVRLDTSGVSGDGFITKGANKLIFKLDDSHVGSFEIVSRNYIDKRRNLLVKLATVDTCHLLFPDQIHVRGVYEFGGRNWFMYFTRMDYCIQGDLWAQIYKYKVDNRVDDLFSIGETLVKLHEKNIYPIDIKPSNIFLCTCDGKSVFTLADLDDSAEITSESGGGSASGGGSGSGGSGSGSGSISTSGISSTSKYSAELLHLSNLKVNKDLLEYIDWHAFSQTFVEYFSKGMYDPKVNSLQARGYIGGMVSLYRNRLTKDGATDAHNRIYNVALFLHRREEPNALTLETVIEKNKRMALVFK